MSKNVRGSMQRHNSIENIAAALTEAIRYGLCGSIKCHRGAGGAALARRHPEALNPEVEAEPEARAVEDIEAICVQNLEDLPFETIMCHHISTSESAVSHMQTRM